MTREAFRFDFLIQRDTNLEEDINGKVGTDCSGSAIVGVEFEEIEEGF